MAAQAVRSDVLVVGAGSAGSIVAAMLSADPACAVTVVESGPGLVDPRLAAEAADATALPIGPDSRLVRTYRSELTRDTDHAATLVRGQTVGGSGAVNGGYFCRGLPSDFAGLPEGWSWPQLLASFRSIETDLDFGGPQHGDSGPIPVRRTSEFCSGTAQFIESAARSGFSWVDDLNDSAVAGASGIGAVPLNVVEGRRHGPGAAYLLPAWPRTNLTVLTQTRVRRILLTGDRAVGVEAVGEDGPIMLTADRIILCAGAIGSAHLLMLSGVGDEEILRKAGVAVRSRLPVGTHCADHPEWLIAAPWHGTPGRPVLEAVLHHKNLEIRSYTSGFAAMAGGSVQRDRPQIGIALMAPRARGRVSLVADDPGVVPRIEHRYDTEPQDLAALRDGVELVGQLLGIASAEMRPQWSTSQHLCHSAPMGPAGDPNAVLDGQCRVHGIEGLWVIDGSALPITGRGPHASIAMLAHRAATMLAGSGAQSVTDR